jgi:methylmalonyl-CoA/ethylmalonyl-CoA epimerase
MTPVLHHVGILVADIPKAAQIYVARFGYRICGEIIHDPVQTAYVQFLQGDSTGPLVELVAPDGAQSKLSNALKKGGGLNHLCYQSENIEQDCRELAAAGMLTLQAPVAATAFPGGRIAWLMGRDGIPIELVQLTSRPA